MTDFEKQKARALNAKKSIDADCRKFNELYHQFIPFLKNNIYSLIKDDQWLVLFAPQKRIKNMYNEDEQIRSGMKFITSNRYKYDGIKPRIDCNSRQYEDEPYIKKDNEIVVECNMNFTDKPTYWKFLPGKKYDYVWNFYLENSYISRIKLELDRMVSLFAKDPQEYEFYPKVFLSCFDKPVWEVSFEDFCEAVHKNKISFL